MYVIVCCSVGRQKPVKIEWGLVSFFNQVGNNLTLDKYTMEHHSTPQIGEIVYVERDDCMGDRIPFEYRLYIRDNTYIYRAMIIDILADRRYNKVQPLPIDDDTIHDAFIRKGYKSKTYKIVD